MFSKKITSCFIILAFFCAVIFYFRCSIAILLFHEGVENTKAVSPFVTGKIFLNGLQYHLLEEPILYFGEEPKWKICNNSPRELEKTLTAISDGSILIEGSFEYLVSMSSKFYGYSMYIKFDDKLLLVDIFADYGGMIDWSHIEPCN